MALVIYLVSPKLSKKNHWQLLKLYLLQAMCPSYHLVVIVLAMKAGAFYTVV